MTGHTVNITFTGTPPYNISRFVLSRINGTDSATSTFVCRGDIVAHASLIPSVNSAIWWPTITVPTRMSSHLIHTLGTLARQTELRNTFRPFSYQGMPCECYLFQTLSLTDLFSTNRTLAAIELTSSMQNAFTLSSNYTIVNATTSAASTTRNG